MKSTTAFAALILWFALGPAMALEGDADAGKARSAVCSACHGADGNSVNPEWPSLAGQYAMYIVTQLEAYQDGSRKNALMSPMAMPLDDQARANLGAYYAAQQMTPKFADPDKLQLGKSIYRGGNTQTGVSACAACHGPNGMGNKLAGMPRLAGQHAAYTANQLRLYASGERRSDMNQMMRNIAAAMSADEIDAVASYVQGLR